MTAAPHKSPRKHRAVAAESASINGCASKYSRGEYVLIEIMSGGNNAISVWMRVDHSDDERSLVFGTIDDDDSYGLGHALRSGAKLAASYGRVLESRVPLQSPMFYIS